MRASLSDSDSVCFHFRHIFTVESRVLINASLCQSFGCNNISHLCMNWQTTKDFNGIRRWLTSCLMYTIHMVCGAMRFVAIQMTIIDVEMNENSVILAEKKIHIRNPPER